MHTDILIVGSGCAGLYCALKLPKHLKITLITKSELEKSDSYLAQGGICVLKDSNDFESFFEDTLKAGHYENDRKSVEIMINSSRAVINELIEYGVEFSRNSDGSLDYTKEGAHTRKRILYHEDITGEEITSKLLKQVKYRQNITLLENTALIDILTDKDECIGGVIARSGGDIDTVYCRATVLATGGIGGLFRHSTNFRHLTGDAIAIAIKHNIELQDIDYIQIHPTTFYSKDESKRSFLISESVRGEGAKLYNKNMERFVDELLPRDLLTEAIKKQMELDSTEYVWEDLRTIPPAELQKHFPHIVEFCKKMGYDVTKECIPVVPAQHYFMGGIKVDHQSRTSMKRLYAIGETACNGVHGRNRLASNSLLESLVFAGRAAEDIAAISPALMPKYEADLSKYGDLSAIRSEYRHIVTEEIKRRQNNV